MPETMGADLGDDVTQPDSQWVHTAKLIKQGSETAWPISHLRFTENDSGE